MDITSHDMIGSTIWSLGSSNFLLVHVSVKDKGIKFYSWK